jgi:two-component system, NarL family, response regulator EvgA
MQGAIMKSFTVLVVDDNRTFLKRAVAFLKDSVGKEIAAVLEASGGYEALALAEEHKPEMILIDLGLPDLSGFSLIPRLRKMFPETAIIVLSLLDTEGYRGAAVSAGADEFVSKADIFMHLMPAIRRSVRTHGHARGRIDSED